MGCGPGRTGLQVSRRPHRPASIAGGRALPFAAQCWARCALPVSQTRRAASLLPQVRLQAEGRLVAAGQLAAPRYKVRGH